MSLMRKREDACRCCRRRYLASPRRSQRSRVRELQEADTALRVAWIPGFGGVWIATPLRWR
eukprot:2095086-Lingulodinium_polyedra.AAC.1